MRYKHCDGAQNDSTTSKAKDCFVGHELWGRRWKWQVHYLLNFIEDDVHQLQRDFLPRDNMVMAIKMVTSCTFL